MGYSTMRNSHLPLEEHIQKLAALFVRHKAYKTLSVHLIRGYFKTPHNPIMPGSNFKILVAVRTK